MISPTVGRKVWYRPRPFETSFEHCQPFDATITYVWNNNCVNLLVLNETGTPLRGTTSVTLAQDRLAQPGECEWMPFQKIQASAQAESIAPSADVHAGDLRAAVTK